MAISEYVRRTAATRVPRWGHGAGGGRQARPVPELHQQLKGKSVTLQLLWEEYREREPLGYRYSRFCELYRQWRRRLELHHMLTRAIVRGLFHPDRFLDSWTVPVPSRHPRGRRSAPPSVGIGNLRADEALVL